MVAVDGVAHLVMIEQHRGRCFMFSSHHSREWSPWTWQTPIAWYKGGKWRSSLALLLCQFRFVDCCLKYSFTCEQTEIISVMVTSRLMENHGCKRNHHELSLNITIKCQCCAGKTTKRWLSWNEKAREHSHTILYYNKYVCLQHHLYWQ